MSSTLSFCLRDLAKTRLAPSALNLMRFSKVMSAYSPHPKRTPESVTSSVANAFPASVIHQYLFSSLYYCFFRITSVKNYNILCPVDIFFIHWHQIQHLYQLCKEFLAKRIVFLKLLVFCFVFYNRFRSRLCRRAIFANKSNKIEFRLQKGPAAAGPFQLCFR